MKTKNFYVNNLVIDTEAPISEGKMQSKCQDCIFCLPGDPTKLWRTVTPDTEGTDSTIFSVKIPDLPEDSTEIFLYYGNSGYSELTNTHDYGSQQDRIESHRQVEDLDFENSGHTGFASRKDIDECFDVWEAAAGEIEEINEILSEVTEFDSSDEDMEDEDSGESLNAEWRGEKKFLVELKKLKAHFQILVEEVL